jgi:tRNA U55 pseudouridine synthase TruB
VGAFSVDSGVSLPELERAFEAGEWRELLLPLDCGLTDLPAITLHIEDEKDIRHGQAVRLDDDRLAGAAVDDGRLHRAYAEDGGLVAVVAYEGATGLWRPRKVFANERTERE